MPIDVLKVVMYAQSLSCSFND